MNEVTLSVMRDLIGISEARRKGYEYALTQITNFELIENFKRNILQSKSFEESLTSLIQEHGCSEITPQMVTSVSDEWIKVESIRLDNQAGMVDSCMKAERITAKAFEAALQDTLPGHIQKIIGNELMFIDASTNYLIGFKL